MYLYKLSCNCHHTHSASWLCLDNVVVYARMLIPRQEFVLAGRDFYMSDFWVHAKGIKHNNDMK